MSPSSPHLATTALRTGDFYRWSKVSESIGGMCAALIFASLLWSIMLNLSLALAPVREDSTGTALVAWLMIGGPALKGQKTAGKNGGNMVENVETKCGLEGFGLDGSLRLSGNLKVERA